MEGWEKQIIFKSGHTGQITDLAWSPNGAYLASSGTDGKVHIWQTKDQTIITTYSSCVYTNKLMIQVYCI
jgi:chromosome transmission fidelity protein 4